MFSNFQKKYEEFNTIILLYYDYHQHIVIRYKFHQPIIHKEITYKAIIIIK